MKTKGYDYHNIDNNKMALTALAVAFICIVGMTPTMSLIIHSGCFHHLWLHSFSLFVG